MKKLFLVDAYALIFKYYYAFLGRPMRNRDGMNTSVVFGFVKFLRDIQKRERPDLLGVAFDPKGGSFRRDIFPEYKANRAETPEDILLSVPYVKRVLEAMCIPILEVEGLRGRRRDRHAFAKGVAAGYDVYMVTPDKDYGQLVRDNCRIYKQKGADGAIEIVGREAIREKYGIDDPVLVRDILALWGDASDNIPGVPGIGEKSACKLVREWGTVENILDNAARIGGRQGEKIAEWGDRLRLAKRLTTICLDVPIPFREEELTVCEPHLDELRAVFAELDFKAFLNDLANLAPPEPLSDGPRQEDQRQLAEMARAKSAAAKKAALAGQGQSVRRSRGPAAGSRSGGRIAGGGRGDATGHGPDHAARIHARPERRAAARGGGRGGPLRRVLLRYGDHGLRHLQRPDRRAVAGRRAAQGVVRSLPRGGCGGVRRDRAAAVRGGADRQDRPERQVRPDGAPAAGDRGPRA